MSGRGGIYEANFTESLKEISMDWKDQEESAGSLGKAITGQGCRQSFTESLISRIHRAESSAHEVAKLRRLGELFDKHPDVREMFELVRDLGVL
jgi:hypothetical protein